MAPAKEKSEASTSTSSAPASEVNEQIAAGTAPADLDKDAKAYCPGCGKRHDEIGATCTGSGSAPHPPIAAVATKELGGDEAKHTPAPASD